MLYNLTYQHTFTAILIKVARLTSYDTSFCFFFCCCIPRKSSSHVFGTRPL